MPHYRASRKRQPTMAELTPESALQAAQRDFAQKAGWWYWHVHDSRLMDAGLPDTILLGPKQSAAPTLWFLENKVLGKRPTDEQRHVLDCLERLDAPPQVRLVTPATWGDVLEELAQRR